MVVESGEYVYVMEFKLNGSAEAALRQIEEREYALPFAGSGRTVYTIGANFDTAKRCLADYVVRCL